MSRRTASPRLLGAAAILALPLAARRLGALEAAPTRVSVTVRLGAAGTGTFRMTGEPRRMPGASRARRSVARGTLRTTQTLTGARGGRS